MAKIHKMLDVCSETEINQQWDGYRTAIGNYLADALILSLGRSMKSLASALQAAKNRPLIRAQVILSKMVIAVNTLTKDMLIYLDAFRKSAEHLIVSGIGDPGWQEIVSVRIESDPELSVISDLIQKEVEDTYLDIQKYLNTLISLKDIWTLKPSSVLGKLVTCHCKRPGKAL